MRIGFYPKLALTGIKKNKRLYKPYILTCIGMIMMYYILSFLATSSIVESHVRGGSVVQESLSLGAGVIGVFALIFLFYTNSFLIRRRKKEFGLYNILGMNKWNIAAILVWESVLLFCFSFLCGTAAGIVLSKFAELGLLNVINTTVEYRIFVSLQSIVNAFVLFAVIFTLILLNTLRQIRKTNAIALLHSENLGEKPPRANWFLGTVGAVILAAAYYIAVSIEDPLDALLWFFIAVIMVIIATYLLFIMGSVMICKILQKSKRYYYQSKHFVAVSSMVYRMKRNGAGLASICILVTMVLVMISSTSCLYIGTEDSFTMRYPKDFEFNIYFTAWDKMSASYAEELKKRIDNGAQEDGEQQYEAKDYYLASCLAGKYGNELELDDLINAQNIGNYHVYLYLISLEDYNEMMEKDETLEENEALVFEKGTRIEGDTITVRGAKTLSIKKKVDDIELERGELTVGIGTIYVVVKDLNSYVKPLQKIVNQQGETYLNYHWVYVFDMSGSESVQMKAYDRMLEAIRKTSKEEYGISHYYAKSKAGSRSSYYNINGSLFFLGVMLSIVFLFAAVLIIYYKQISEGYEDESRFAIMQKVGMTKKEIRKSINSQILTVFFLPLLTAGLHLCFAFPVIKQLLVLFGIVNDKILMITTFGSFLLFAALYVVIYRITSNAYYAIVSGAKEE